MTTGSTTTKSFRRRTSAAWTFGLTLVGLAAFAGWCAVELHDPHGADPHWSGSGTAAIMAAGFVARAEWSIIALGRARTSGWAAAGWIAAAVLALFALLVVAVAGNLGG